MSKLSTQQKSELESKIRDSVPESRTHKYPQCKDVNNWEEPCEYCYQVMGKECTGRPLGLQDVFITLRSGGNAVKAVETFSRMEDERLNRPVLYSEVEHEILRLYDLTKDYSGQSEEFYVFLHSLLL